MFHFFCCLGEGVFDFSLFGRGPRPCANSKKQNTPRPNSKEKTRTPPEQQNPPSFLIAPLRSLIFGVFFCCLGGGRVLFLLFGRCVSFFAVWASACFLFWCLGGVVEFLLFGRGSCFIFFCERGACFFCCCWGGDGSSLTYRPAWLGFKGPNNKKDQTAKKKQGFRESAPEVGATCINSSAGLGNLNSCYYCISLASATPYNLQHMRCFHVMRQTTGRTTQEQNAVAEKLRQSELTLEPGLRQEGSTTGRGGTQSVAAQAPDSRCKH